ncbi:hypothetical protein MTDSW087_05342 [Methylobacterium dankookense]|uniref:Uncharacterized protein n=2 Tax=Methylobacterium dankookense TaxID=560405 RepID=A0A564G523_9HYPH|nr:hypothetical protein IFDJLNFL_1165 [Methylobacterium dankookense]VUF15599.1 hypothetical protein MTDSW087_05342 [Methylobacterium dankookense]
MSPGSGGRSCAARIRVLIRGQGWRIAGFMMPRKIASTIGLAEIVHEVPEDFFRQGRAMPTSRAASDGLVERPDRVAWGERLTDYPHDLLW